MHYNTFFRGLNKDGKEAFRLYFAKVGDLRSFFTHVPLMGLTATHSVQNSLHYCLYVLNRPNITMQVEKVIGDVSCLTWLAGMLSAQGNSCLKTNYLL